MHRPSKVDQTVVVVTRRHRGAVVLVVTGELDIDNVATLSSALHEAGAQGSVPVVIDLSGVTFADSTTVNIILGARAELQSRLRLAAPSPFMARLISLIGLDAAVPVHPTVDGAAAASAAVEPQGSE